MRRALGWRRRRGATTRTIRTAGRAGIDLCSVLKFILAINHDDITGIQSGAQAHAVTGGLRDGDDTNFRGVVGTGGVHVSSLRTALDGGSRNDRKVVLGVHEKVDIDKLIREKHVVRVGKNGLQLVSSCGWINLIIDRLQFSAGDFGGVVAVVGVNDQLSAGTQLAVHYRKLILWQAENHRDGLQLGDDQKSVGVAGMHDVTGVNQTQADASADRRGDPGIRELELGVVNLALL